MANRTFRHPQRTAAGADNDELVTLYDESDGTYAPVERVRLMGWDGTGWVKIATDSTGASIDAIGTSIDSDDTAPPQRVAAEQLATKAGTDRDGTIFVRTHGPQLWSYHENSSAALTDAAVHAAPAAGLSLYVTDIVVSTGAATAFSVFFEEGVTTVLGPYYLEAIAGRGVALHFQTPKKITAATALTVTTSPAMAHAIDVTGFTAQG